MTSVRIIGKPPTFDVAFDTNVLSDLVDSQLRTRLLDRARALGARLVAPSLAIEEMAAPGSAKSRGQAEALLDLFERAPDRTVVGADLGTVMRAERRGTVRRVPHLVRDEAELVLHIAASGQHCDVIKQDLAKDATAALDAAALSTADDHTSDLLRRARAATPRDVRRLVPEMLAGLLRPGSFGLEELLVDPAWVAQVRCTPHRHRAAILATGQLVLHVLSVFFPRNARGGVTDIMPDHDNNDWVDLRIVGSCAHARDFVSNDRRLRSRVNYLGAQIGTKLRAVTVADWLGDAATSTTAGAA